MSRKSRAIENQTWETWSFQKANQKNLDYHDKEEFELNKELSFINYFNQ